MGKADFSKVFHEVVSLITSFFPHAKPSSSISSEELYPWMDVVGTSNRHSPCIFLAPFDKLLSVSKEVNEKFRKAADDKKKAPTALPRWGDVYRLGDLDASHKAPRVNESFSRLLDKAVSPSYYVALSLDDTAKLETCVCGLTESQSFSLWALATMFEFLKDSSCVLEDTVLRQLIASMTTTLNSQAKASFSAAAFLQQVWRVSFVSYLPSSTHASVKHALLSTPSTSALFGEEVILHSLTQVRDDSFLSLLRNPSSLKDEKQSASTASTSDPCWLDSSSSSSSSGYRSFSRGSYGLKRPSSLSPEGRL